ncbi:MAG: TIGR03960 family B12-binding radical SAM protein [Desulfohalobiaceae bacterium]
MQDLIPLLKNPSHYLGTEFGAVHKDPSQASLRWALAFPDLYNVGMSYLGQKILYHILNQQSWIWAERVFAPQPEAAHVLRSQGRQLCTLESKTSLDRMDIIGFSLTQELCYTTVLYMLDLAGIPLYSSQRGDNAPLILGGGGMAFSPEPMADFFDLFLLGDGEDAVLEISRTLLQAKRDRLSKQEVLSRLKELPGIYVPAFFQLQPGHCTPAPLLQDYCQVEKRTQPYLRQEDFPEAQILPFGKPVHDRLSLEIARGCTRGCRFCQAGMITRPVRERSQQELESTMLQALSATGYEELSFLSLSTGDFSSLEGLFAKAFARCSREKVAISLPSLRAGSLSPQLMQLLGRLRRTGITLAPEAGSQRLREVINKDIQEQELLQHCQDLFSLGWSGVKLYFMIGLPTETDQDLEAILDLCLKVQHTAGKLSRRTQITASIAPFVPKAHTPFQWAGQISLQETRRRISLLKDLFQGHKNLKLRWHQPEMSFLEGVFSRGDRQLGQVLHTAYQDGDILSSWQEHFSLQLWLQAFKKHGLDPEAYLQARAAGQGLPWDHLHTGVHKDYLLEEWQKSIQGHKTLDCRFQACSQCGVCSRGVRSPEQVRQDPTAGLGPVLNQRCRDQEQQNSASLDLPDSEQGSKEVQLRIWFTKTGPAKYLSQLELQGCLERALRRADLPLSFSQGFHPKPLLSFPRALPVGVASWAEWFCVALRSREYPRDTLCRLNQTAPQGLEFIEAQELPPGKKPAPASREEFELGFNLQQEKCSRLVAAWQDILQSSNYPLSLQGKKGPRHVDLRPLLAEVRQTSPCCLRLLLDWSQDYISPLKLIQAVHPELGGQDFELCKLSQS